MGNQVARKGAKLLLWTLVGLGCGATVAGEGSAAAGRLAPLVFQVKQANVRLVSDEHSCVVWIKLPGASQKELETRLQLSPPCDVMTMGPQYGFKPAIRSLSGTRPWFRIVGSLSWEANVRSECGTSWFDVEIDLIKPAATILPKGPTDRVGYCPRRWDEDIYW